MRGKLIMGLCCMALAACGGGSTSLVTTAVDDVVFQDFGVSSGAVGSNATAFATGEDSYATLDTSPLTLKVIRIDRDPVSRDVRVYLTDETFVLEKDFTTRFSRDATFTLSGQDWDTDNQPTGIFVGFRQSILSDYIGEMLIADDTGGVDEVFTRGFTLLGRETDPAMMPAGQGNIGYVGRFVLEGFPSVNGGRESEFTSLVTGDAAVTLGLADRAITGELTGTYMGCGGACTTAIGGDLTPTTLSGNGFTTDTPLGNCTGSIACRGTAQMGGVFYDSDAGVLAGLLSADLSLQGLPFLDQPTQDHDLQMVGYFYTDRQD